METTNKHQWEAITAGQLVKKGAENIPVELKNFYIHFAPI